MPADQSNRDRWRRYWDKHSASYDKQMGFFDRVLFGDSRAWVCSQATGDTLEVAIGTGLNLLVTVPLQGEHFLRRPLRHVQAQGLTIERRERFKLGLTERLAARKPAPDPPNRQEASATGSQDQDRPAGS